jgi:membrane protein YdbS with pleckstrin-like domain
MGYAEKNLAPGETILYRARYHWVFYSFSIIVLVLAAALGLAAWRATQQQAGDEIGRPLGWIAAAFAAIALLAFLARRFRANMDEFVVTNRRVIRKVGVFAREIQHAPIEKIQDVTIEQGILGRILGYGTVIVETASEKGMLVFPAIASPESMRTHIWGQAPAAIPAAAAAVASPSPSPAAASVTAQKRLEDLQSLKQRGLVDDGEYAAKKKEILSHL